ncbi:hypothetical protein BSLG_001257 [Batrachochytrium salamandrivorans]|nr:hypothetical protein BSLG_001257 [Batrachochytrium salamandrivorans]
MLPFSLKHSILSVSADVQHRPDVIRMGLCGAASQQQLEGQEIDLPPIILATYGTDPTKKTVLVYGHYDVQPASKEDGWATDPFTLVEDDQGQAFGRGSTDDKGPVISWLWVIQAHQKLGLSFQRQLLAWNSKPCLTYGLRGISYFTLAVQGPAKDLHSGLFGGAIHEPMTDLIQIMQTLVDPKGKSLCLESWCDDVAPVTADELAKYKAPDFTMNDMFNAMGGNGTIFGNTEQVLIPVGVPITSLHGIEGAFSGAGAKTVIPAKVIGKFSIRSVPNMEPAKITALVEAHVSNEFLKLGTKNTFKLVCDNPESGGLQIPLTLTMKVYNTTPDYTREGGSIPVTMTFQEALNKNDGGAHSINEKMIAVTTSMVSSFSTHICTKFLWQRSNWGRN